jgi:acyl-CoA reductase-like NAD-dependent aldehyde dehydrogenase
LNDWAPVLECQRRYFRTGATFPLAFRRAQLLKLDRLLRENETRIAQALAADLGKPTLEAYAAETGFLRAEIRYALTHLSRWMAPERVPSPLALFPASSRIEREPLGVVLVIAPWNFPVQLTLGPWIGALAAGNCAILKPSEIAPHSSKLLCQLLEENFPRELVAVATGGAETSQALLQLRFDRILFTGGRAVAREVAAAAAKTLSPLTLELGGKNPVILDTDFDLGLAARRISWAKFLNAGQTCIAPDYVLVPERRKAELIQKLAENVRRSFGQDPRRSPDYGRIVSAHHFDRIEGILKHGRITLGGDRDRDSLYIAPTVMEDAPPGSPPLEEEIFGPILPIVPYQDLDDAIAFANQHPDPLALYVFSSRKHVQRKVLRGIPSGGSAVNDLVLQFMNPRLPFGGRGSSGVGEYHGRFGFELFSHKRAVVQGARFLDIPLRYPPYRGKLGWLKRILR